MDSTVINEKSTKAQIIDAATELVSIQEDKLMNQTNKIQQQKEEMQSLVLLLVLTTCMSLLF